MSADAEALNSPGGMRGYKARGPAEQNLPIRENGVTPPANTSAPAPETEDQPSTFSSVVRRVFGGDSPAITVKGHDDLLVYRARCCNPIRGEEIVGYVTRGKGVT